MGLAGAEEAAGGERAGCHGAGSRFAGRTGSRARCRGPHWGPAPSYARHVPWTHRVLPPKEVQGSHFQDGETEAQSSYRACALNHKATGRSAVIGVAPPVLSQGYQSTQNPPFPRADNRLPPQGDCVRRALETPRTGSRRGHRPGTLTRTPTSKFMKQYFPFDFLTRFKM